MPANEKDVPYLVPALRGIFGTWVYYSAMVRLSKVAKHVKFAKEIRTSQRLSEMIQRELNDKRAKEISTYLCQQNERFLNSLVVAVYGGEPQWFSLSQLDVTPDGFDAKKVEDDDLATVGFLSMSGRENFFALDGQHRLAGIRNALKVCPDCANDEINVLFVAHQETEEGRKRTRRLFTTLNKRAKAVAKGPIIALDEDDAMAIVCRRLVEEHPYFMGARIAYQATNNMPVKNQEAFTTIGALYDALMEVFCGIYKGNREKLRFYRPSDDEMETWYERAHDFIRLCYKHFSAFSEFCNAGECFGKVTAAQRNSQGGAVLFRPIGFIIFAEVMAALSDSHKKAKLDMLFAHAASISWTLSKPPFVSVIWNAQSQRMVTGTKVLCRDLVLFVLGEEISQKMLADKYAKATGVSMSAAETYLAKLTRLEPIRE